MWSADEIAEHPTNIAVVYISYLRRKLSKLGTVCAIRTIPSAGCVLDVEAASAEPTTRPALGTRRRAR